MVFRQRPIVPLVEREGSGIYPSAYVISGFVISQITMPKCVTVRFDLEDGPGGSGGGRALLEASSPSGAGLVLSNFPPQRRESFLYRSDSEFEMSPKSVSRHSSIGSEA
ncbi:hypothetical protein HPB50_015380 [Hyalomma asiaticum]|uniref:Uncharacterized protein n=1 Tax=Hyalomma asiaticum TaxID=266040 RepID=A0ACB7T4Q0_HYAAI|nr:hypothetical protein HPB50_015380 [Hyalomma asiaticum]